MYFSICFKKFGNLSIGNLTTKHVRIYYTCVFAMQRKSKHCGLILLDYTPVNICQNIAFEKMVTHSWMIMEMACHC